MQFGARYVDPLEGQVFDYLPETMLTGYATCAFAGMLRFDKWTCNSNGRQAVFWKKARERKLTATFIDQGYCFNAGEWNFPTRHCGAFSVQRCVPVCTWESFEPWLSKIENFPERSLWPLGRDSAGVVRRLERAGSADRGAVPAAKESCRFIEEFRNSSRSPFPDWVAAAKAN